MIEYVEANQIKMLNIEKFGIPLKKGYINVKRRGGESILQGNKKHFIDTESTSYYSLFKKRGAKGALKSAIFVIFWYLFNEYLLGIKTQLEILIIGYVFFCCYFTFKPKLLQAIKPGKISE